MDENDVMITMLTDSMELYRSRLHEMHQESGEYSERRADTRSEYGRIDDAGWSGRCDDRIDEHSHGCTGHARN